MSERLWLCFFGDTVGGAWWAHFLRPGFRHIAAASYFADQERWVVFDPSRRRTVIHVLTEDQIGPVLGQMLERSSAVLRVASSAERMNAPALACCTGSIKALLGIRSWALTPFGLYRDLLARGAEVVIPPCVVAEGEARAPSAP